MSFCVFSPVLQSARQLLVWKRGHETGQGSIQSLRGTMRL